MLWAHSHFLLPTGGTKYIFEVARRVASERPLEMVVESASDLWRARYAEEGIPLHELGGRTSTSMLYWAGFPAFLRRDRRGLAQLLRGQDAVVTSFFPMPVLADQVAPRGLRHVSLCFEPFPFFHDDEVIGLYPPPKRLLLRTLKALYGRLDATGIRAADRLLTLNKVTAAQIERVYGRSDAQPIYAGVDTCLFRPYAPDELADLRERLGEGPFVIHSTDFSPIKRTDLALEAFAVAARLVDGCRLLVTSTRDDAKQLAAFRRRAVELDVGDRIDYLGFVPFADVPRLYALSSALLQTGTSVTSGATSMSLPVKEAMACGTPVVRSAATDEDVIDGVSGFLVDPRDTETTGRQLAALVANPALAKEMGERGRERIAATYTWPKVATQVLQALEP